MKQTANYALACAALAGCALFPSVSWAKDSSDGWNSGNFASIREAMNYVNGSDCMPRNISGLHGYVVMSGGNLVNYRIFVYCRHDGNKHVVWAESSPTLTFSDETGIKKVLAAGRTVILGVIEGSSPDAQTVVALTASRK